MRSHPRSGALGVLLVLSLGPGAASTSPSIPPVRAVVLGVAQDGGVPHIGCTQPLCVRARRDPRARRPVAALGLIDDRVGRRYLIDATPDIASQLERLNRGRRREDGRRPVDGIFLTHAHIGHYTGLMYLGREALGARAVPVYATPRMAAFLRGNGPWSLLVSHGHVELREIEPLREVELTPSLAITAIPVPHRDELSDTVAFRARGRGRSLLYLPDVDKWEKWTHTAPIEQELRNVDTALLDGTFLSADEVPGRSIADIPHPLVGETRARFASLARRVLFIHLNHTNRLLWDPAALAALRRAGFDVATEGRVISLET